MSSGDLKYIFLLQEIKYRIKDLHEGI